MNQIDKALAEIVKLTTPSPFERLSNAEWAISESLYGELPIDYKKLVSTLGSGSFGDLAIFTPMAIDVSLRLPDAETAARETIKLYDCCTDTPLTSSDRILGYIDNRRSLVYADGIWCIYDWEMGDRFDIGDNLPAFLHEAYMSISRGGALKHIAETIWKLSYDNKTRVPIFTPSQVN